MNAVNKKISGHIARVDLKRTLLMTFCVSKTTFYVKHAKPIASVRETCHWSYSIVFDPLHKTIAGYGSICKSVYVADELNFLCMMRNWPVYKH
jgi:hypothetical protein